MRNQKNQKLIWKKKTSSKKTFNNQIRKFVRNIELSRKSHTRRLSNFCHWGLCRIPSDLLRKSTWKVTRLFLSIFHELLMLDKYNKLFLKNSSKFSCLKSSTNFPPRSPWNSHAWKVHKFFPRDPQILMLEKSHKFFPRDPPNSHAWKIPKKFLRNLVKKLCQKSFPKLSWQIMPKS